MELTLCLIVKNEEHNLPRCISSFKGLYNELVIVDTGSTDRTVEISKEFNANVYRFNWIEDFSAARNFALDKVKTKWVFMVDADDIIEENPKQELIAYLKKIPPNIDGILLKYVYSNINGNQGQSAYLARIWRADLGLKYVLPIHEYLNIKPAQMKKFVRLNIPIKHTRKETEIGDKIQRNLSILNKNIQKDPGNLRLLFYLGHDNYYAGNYDESIHWYQQYLDSKPTSKDEINRIYYGMGRAYLMLGKEDKAGEAFALAIKSNPDFVEPYLQLGDLAFKHGDYEEAANRYFNAMQCVPPKTHVFFNTRLYGNYPQEKLNEALKHLEKNK